MGIMAGSGGIGGSVAIGGKPGIMGGSGGFSRSCTMANLPSAKQARKIEKASKNHESTWILVTTFLSHRAGVTDICLTVRGCVCSASLDRSVRIWDPFHHICLQELKGHEDGVNALFFVPSDGNSLWTASRDGTLGVWVPKEGREEVNRKVGGEEGQEFKRELNKAYVTYQKNLERDRNSQGGEGGNGEPEGVEEGTSLEKKIQIIDKNIAGLKEMSVGNSTNKEKALRLCDHILRDLKVRLVVLFCFDFFFSNHKIPFDGSGGDCTFC